MFKLAVLFAFVVCSSTVHASPSAPPVQRAPGLRDHCGEVGAGLTTATPPENVPSSVDVTIQHLQQTISLQTQTIQGLLNTVQNLTSVALAPHCATEDVMRSVVHGAIAPLQKTVSELTPTHCDCEEQLATAVAPLQMTIGNLTQYIQIQNNTIHQLTNTILNMTTTIRLPPTDCGLDSGYEYYNETGSCYKYHEKELVWTQANETCVSEGAQLAVVNGREEARLLGGMFAKANLYHAALVGYRRDSDGVWRAVTGETLEAAATYSPWGAGLPDSEAERMYAGMWRDGTLINMDDDWKSPFICEKRPH